MKATKFTRDDCWVGKRHRTYKELQLEYRCNDCGARLVMKWSDDERYPEFWHVECAGCNGTDFIHEREVQMQESEAIEVLDGLPPEMAALLQPEQSRLPERPAGVIFSLNQD